MRTLTAALAASLLLLGAAGARADVLYDWSFDGDLAGSGTLEVNGSTVDSITGSWNGYQITGLSTWNGADNQVPLDENGISFDLSGGDMVSVWGDDPTLFNDWEWGGGTGTFTDTLAAAATPAPEPATLALLGAGLLGLTAARRRRA